MKEEVARAWAGNLRSGDYLQGKIYLCKRTGGMRRWCCLGVLADMALQDNIKINPEELSSGIYYIEGVSGTLGKKVSEWGGLKSSVGIYDDGSQFGSSLAADNDSGKSFAEIADIIEANWEKL